MKEETGSCITLGYLGPRGTFTDQAARQFAAVMGQEAVLTAYRSIPDILYDVQGGVIDRGIVPIENSTEGSVNVTLDALVHDVEVQIDAELVLPIRHHLLVKKGYDVGDIEQIFSHPQALAQCRKNIEKLLPKATVVAAGSTAEAARRVSRANSRSLCAAIGTELAASHYGLSIAIQDLQDFRHNATRFIRVGRDFGLRSGRDKTSVVFAFDTDKPGNLYRALKVFANRHINLTKLESRPAKRSLGDYIFLADMEGYFTDEPIAEALELIKGRCAFFKMLGSYPRVDHPGNNGQGI